MCFYLVPSRPGRSAHRASLAPAVLLQPRQPRPASRRHGAGIFSRRHRRGGRREWGPDPHTRLTTANMGRRPSWQEASKVRSVRGSDRGNSRARPEGSKLESTGRKKNGGSSGSTLAALFKFEENDTRNYCSRQDQRCPHNLARAHARVLGRQPGRLESDPDQREIITSAIREISFLLSPFFHLSPDVQAVCLSGRPSLFGRNLVVHLGLVSRRYAARCAA